MGSQRKGRHLGFPRRSFKISAAATAPAELAKGPSASVAVQTVPHHAPSTAVDVQVHSLAARACQCFALKQQLFCRIAFLVF